MKKVIAYVGVLLSIALCYINIATVNAKAVDIMATVEGTIATGSSNTQLNLDTPAGKMEIKIDSSTPIEGKNFLPGHKVVVAVYRGDDSWLHAASIKESTNNSLATIDTSNKYTVTGQIKDVSTSNILYFATSAGDMEIKFDASTDISGVSRLMANGYYTVICARGSDAYLHALAMADSAPVYVQSSNSGSQANTTTYSNANVSGTTYTSTGTVSDKTTATILYFNSNGEGERQFKIDANTDVSSGYVLTAGRPMTVTYAYGDDAYWHAVSISGKMPDSGGASVNTANTVDVSGTIGGNCDNNIIRLQTGGGEMELKYDTLSSLGNAKFLRTGQKINANIGYGSDGYWHLLSLTAQN